MSVLPLPASYDAADRERYVAEDRKSAARTDFERDRARIMYSSAMRRLGAKTQVLGPSSDDFVRTRLTHSIEVSQVGRALGREVGADPDVVDAACLAHDLGHPPFGHNGERALNHVAASCGGFEGNAQTFRLLTRLEPKKMDGAGRPVGLNLTRASLDAVAKYPWVAGEGPDPEYSARKYSVYADDVRIFEWVREGAPRGRRTLEAQIMDISDDIAYSVHDVEDAIRARKLDPSVIRDDAQREAVWRSTQKWYGPQITMDELDAALDRLVRSGFLLSSFGESYRDLAALKDMTSAMIGRLCDAVVEATRPEGHEGGLHRYDCDLVVPRQTRAEIQALKGLAVHFVMAPRELEPVYLRQRTLIFDLVDALVEARGRHLEAPYREQWEVAEDDAARLRAVIDQVAAFTDHAAHQWHARYCGMFSAV
ncbi:deoxyguanosinetriphosphate triphosphohydrolase [Nanchangia anserum]|uniref:Deoxyguanosinetriphosphate triphosphohydrolase-like protein n=1 Tax=Nanchangia anserum TaxID=2692125 RepID=A0A8I0GCK4_9ACTO|nr:deoxyguanosinetriphosphate triphosphohydrolase [Nanchangia anserum]MBD3689073.1 deoxyguanosinetriphosphate triphosphohydrolase [Nanchangia anserum]QOX81313.1 deoxyguanosinetriphosphate triphosphohydrolase [Nanchangia anserum]